jgi:long-chain acyl-CoA synthetase
MNAIVDLQTRPWYATYKECAINPVLPDIAEKSLADYIENHVRQFAAKPAIEYLGITISYGELDTQANRMANLLQGLGVKKGDVIGMHLPNTPQYLIGLVAAAKVGAAVSGVSPLLTATEIIHQVNDAGIKVLLTLDQFYKNSVALIDGKTPSLQAVLVSSPIDFLPGWKKWLAYTLKKIPKITPAPMQHSKVLDYFSEMKKSSANRVYTKLAFNDTIYVQYTGGTTGKPKGAELTLLSMFANARQCESFTCYAPGTDTMASAFPYFHMAGLAVALLCLQQAGRLLAIPDPRNVDLFCKAMKKFPPTFMANVPTLYQMLYESPAFKEVDFSQLKMALSGAAPFPPEMIHQLEKFIGKGRLGEVYGMTETSPLLTCNPPTRPRIGTVGIPIVGTDIKIVDVETGETEMPLGEAGELIARGPQIMKGYLNLPEASAKSLRVFEGETWIYTGDIAKMDEEGYLTICDRSKDMLIVGGYKVFSVEIESKLAELDFIELSAIIGKADEKRPGNDIVHLYLQLKPDARNEAKDVLEEKVMQFCRANMAAFKVPKHIHFMDALPLTAVGKLDKKSLRQ